MPSIKNIVYIVAAALCCGLLSSGCARDEVDMLSEQGHNVEVELNIGKSAADATTGSLTAAEGKIYSLRVYAFSDGRTVGHFYKEYSENPTKVYMHLAFLTEGVQKVDFYVIANEKNLKQAGVNAKPTENTTEAQINSYWFNNIVRATMDTEGLPMVAKVSRELDFTKVKTAPADAGEHAGHLLLDLGDQPIEFALERPVAKISLFAAKEADEDATLRITGITVPTAGTQARGYLMPQTKDVLEKIVDGGVDIPVAVLNNATDGKPGAVVSKTIAADATAEFKKDPNNYTPVMAQSFYPFENPYSNGGSWDKAGNGREHVWVIKYEFDNVINGSTITREGSGVVHMPALERNKYYVICCLIRNDGHLNIEYSVADWEKVEFGTGDNPIVLDYPQYVNPIQPGSGEVVQPNEKYQQPEIWYSPDSDEGSYTFLFTVFGPHGLEWTPTLFGQLGSTDNFEIEVYEQYTEGVRDYLYDTGNPLPHNPIKFDKNNAPYTHTDGRTGRRYYITVKAKKSLEDLGTGNPDVPHTVGLGVAFQRNWEQDDNNSDMLLINGLTDNLRWTNSRFGEYIEIKQVDVPTAQQN